MFVYAGTSVTLESSSNPDAQTFVNGQLLSAPTLLHHVCQHYIHNPTPLSLNHTFSARVIVWYLVVAISFASTIPWKEGVWLLARKDIETLNLPRMSW